MIRSVRIPLGQTSSSITYAGSTCDTIDPLSGLCVADFYLGDPTNAAAGGGGLPGDPGDAEALQQWALKTKGDASAAGLNQLVLAESLNAGNIPSPLPGLGLTIPNPVRNWLLIGGAVVAGVALLSSGGRRR